MPRALRRSQSRSRSRSRSRRPTFTAEYSPQACGTLSPPAGCGCVSCQPCCRTPCCVQSPTRKWVRKIDDCSMMECNCQTTKCDNGNTTVKCKCRRKPICPPPRCRSPVRKPQVKRCSCCDTNCSSCPECFTCISCTDYRRSPARRRVTVTKYIDDDSCSVTATTNISRCEADTTCDNDPCSNPNQEAIGNLIILIVGFLAIFIIVAWFNNYDLINSLYWTRKSFLPYRRWN